jgi:hypothetical protein
MGRGMAENESPEPTEVEHSYLDVGRTGPRKWVLMIGAILVSAAILAAFYGLYTINQGPSPTLSPDPLALTQEAIVPDAPSASAVPAPTIHLYCAAGRYTALHRRPA